MTNHELDNNEILVDFISSSSHSEIDSHINKSTQLESLFGDSDHEIYSSSFLININNRLQKFSLFYGRRSQNIF